MRTIVYLGGCEEQIPREEGNGRDSEQKSDRTDKKRRETHRS